MFAPPRLASAAAVLATAFAVVVAVAMSGCGGDPAAPRGASPVSAARDAGGLPVPPDAGPEGQAEAPIDAPIAPSTPICREAICCVGPGCPKRVAGSPCQTDDQCETTFCADGVCCNVACTGSCVACNQADRMGECTPVAVGDPDPHLQCRRDPPDSCGQSGVCNGQGGCAKYTSGTPCGESRCGDNNAMNPAAECDGEGSCTGGEPVACAPFLCEGAGCRVTCASDAHCAPGRVCINGSCGLRGRGQLCTASDQCESGHCVDGVCCESACRGRCMTCASARARGMCLPVAAGTVDPRVQLGTADPATICVDEGATSCGLTGRCDGKGGCETYRNGTTCAPARCDAGSNSATAPSVCRAGRCESPTMRSCAPFRGCAGNACSTRCAGDGDCVPGMVCLGGTCGKRAIGSPCSRDVECAAPGVCAQGRCCSAVCNRPCMACNLEGSLGSCQPVPAGGADPAGTCRNDACNNGCDGEGSCRREAEGTTCGAAACAADGSLRRRICTLAGVCVDSVVPCAAGHLCRAGSCVPDCPAGALSCAGACTDTLTNPRHCGGCDRACDGPTSVCSGGKCVRPTPPPMPPGRDGGVPGEPMPTKDAGAGMPGTPAPIKDAGAPGERKDAATPGAGRDSR